MFRGRDPQARLPVLKRLVLAGEIDTLTLVAGGIAAALRESASTLGELRRDRCVLRNPVCEGIFAVLDNAV
jgi:hypothetical protein